MTKTANLHECLANKCREAGSESTVLLKNDDRILPFTESDCVSIFGRSQINYIRSGTGSGGLVKVDYIVNILDGFRNHHIKINDQLASHYIDWIKSHPYNDGNGVWGAEPWFQSDMEISLEFAQQQAKISNKAMYIISRTAGEDQDNFNGCGSYLLTKEEEVNLKNITSAFENVVVALNVSNIIDMQWINNPIYQNRIKGVCYLWCGGNEGGNSVAEVLSGKVSPSGKLPDTIPVKLEDHPATKNFGSRIQNYYQEDIYVGYRYFETFAPGKVMYEFGFGLSYTSFDIEIVSSKYENGIISLDVKVTNTGSQYSGKEVVQIYYSAPQGKLGKPLKQLIAFQKTKMLKPNEHQNLTFEFNENQMASYDDSNITGNKSCYVLEEGEYNIFVGTSVRNVKLGLTFSMPQLKVIEKLSEVMCPNDKSFTILVPGDIKPDGTYTEKYIPSQQPTVDLAKRIQDNLPKEIPITGDIGITFDNVKQGKASLEDFIAQFTVDQLAQFVRGEGMNNPLVCPGTASAFGGVSDQIRKYGTLVACCADGPNGLRYNGTTMQIPMGTALAATFNPELIYNIYHILGNELRQHNVDSLLGPGVNIHRHPLNGRNFEYYSEDPYLSGIMTTASTKGLHEAGICGTVKHFALNNQETERRKVNSICSERAIREIYLKSFEMPVKAGTVFSIMTSYNPINGHWSGSNYDLTTTVLRGEWKYTGVVMTDWWAAMNDVVEGGNDSLQKIRDMVRAQNDLYMIVNNAGSEINAYDDDAVESVQNGRLTIGELQRCAMNICNFLLNKVSHDVSLPPKAKSFKSLQENEVKTDIIVLNNHTNRIELKKQKELTLKVVENGEYLIGAKMIWENGNYQQSTIQILINGELAGEIREVQEFLPYLGAKIVNVVLEAGIYKVQINDAQPGLLVNSLVINKL